MERIMTRKAFALAGMAAALLTAPAFAHHSFAIFDGAKMTYITGTVKQFELVNPHTWLHVTFTNDKGDPAEWAFEGGSVLQLQRLGWSNDNVKVGEKVEVGFHPMKDGSRGGQLMSIKLLDNGQKLCSNRGCGDGTGSIVPGEYRDRE
jgi:hypothetical protein